MAKTQKELTEKELKQVAGGRVVGPDVKGTIGSATADGVLYLFYEKQEKVDTLINPLETETMSVLKNDVSAEIYNREK